MKLKQALKRFVQGEVEVPGQEFFARQEMNNRFTPDLMELEASVWQRLFVPDNLMLGYPQHNLIKNHGLLQAHAFTTKHFSMWRNREGHFPVILQPRDPRNSTQWQLQDQYIDKLNHHAIIKGQLFAVMSSQFPVIDTFMKRGKEFNRIRIKIDIPLRDVVYFGEKGVETQARRMIQEEAWVYVGLPQFWDHQIDGGYQFTPVRMYKPPASLELITQPYYFFSRMEM